MGMELLPFLSNSGTIPFINDTLCGYLFVVTCILAIVVGLRQTLWESSRGTFHFLLHRPARRDAIFGVKLLVGEAACLAISLLPVACYALWATAPGTHASPFAWSMSGWAWRMSFEMPVVYLGAFLSGLRLHDGSPAVFFRQRPACSRWR